MGKKKKCLFTWFQKNNKKKNWKKNLELTTLQTNKQTKHFPSLFTASVAAAVCAASVFITWAERWLKEPGSQHTPLFEPNTADNLVSPEQPEHGWQSPAPGFLRVRRPAGETAAEDRELFPCSPQVRRRRVWTTEDREGDSLLRCFQTPERWATSTHVEINHGF